MTRERPPKGEKLCSQCGKPYSGGHHRRTKCYDCSPEGSTSKAKTKTGPAAATATAAPRAISIPARTTRMVASIGAVVVTIGKGWETASPERAIKLQADGMAIVQGAGELGAAIGALADEHPALKKALETSYRAGSWARLAGAIAGIALPIAANHGVLPLGALNALGGLTAPPAPAGPDSTPSGGPGPAPPPTNGQVPDEPPFWPMEADAAESWPS